MPSLLDRISFRHASGRTGTTIECCLDGERLVEERVEAVGGDYTAAVDAACAWESTVVAALPSDDRLDRDDDDSTDTEREGLWLRASDAYYSALEVEEERVKQQQRNEAVERCAHYGLVIEGDRLLAHGIELKEHPKLLDALAEGAAASSLEAFLGAGLLQEVVPRLAAKRGLDCPSAFRPDYIEIDNVDVRLSDHAQRPGGGFDLGSGERFGESTVSLYFDAGSEKVILQRLPEDLAEYIRAVDIDENDEIEATRRGALLHELLQRLHGMTIAQLLQALDETQ